MTFIDRGGGSIGEEVLLERIRRYRVERPSTIRSVDPVRILAGVLAAFTGGFRVALEDVSGVEEEAGGSTDCPLPQDIGIGEIRDLLLKGRPEGEVVLYTSGTTGKPAAVNHGWPSLFRGTRVGAKHRDAVWALCYNPSHVAGLQVLLQAFLNGCDLVDLFNAEPDERAASLRRAGVTHLSATPSWLRILVFDLAGEPPFETVRGVTLGGERFDAPLAAAARGLFPHAEFRNIYAATEFGTLLVSERDDFTLPKSLSGHVRIEGGRLMVSADLLAGSEDAREPWYDTGDRVEILSEHPIRFRFVGRESDHVSVGGYNVNLAAVEFRLREHTAVREARVVARPNSVLGQILTADVVPRGSGVTEADLRNYLEKHFPPYAVPRMIRVVENLNLSRTGKLER